MAAPTPNTSSEHTSFTPASADTHVNALLSGTKWGGAVGERATVYYSFATSKASNLWSADATFGYGGANAEHLTLTALNSTQKNGVKSALASWSNVANIDFVQVTETSKAVGDIRFGFTSSGEMNASTYAYTYIGETDDTQTSIPIFGDIWFNKNQPVSTGYNFKPGAMGHLVTLHEIGHALGLEHSFADGPGDIVLDNEYEQYLYSVMSYSDTPSTNDDGLNDFYPTTPMLFDILAIQYLYGANMTYNTGNNTYTFSDSKFYYQTIWDAGGVDTIKYSAKKDGLIDLREGHFSQLGKPIGVGPNNSLTQKNTVAIAYGVEIENAIGGSRHDIIRGNDIDNRLDGAGGNDTIEGDGGNDTLIGGSGNDYLDGGLDADRMEGGTGNDVYVVDDVSDLVIEKSAAGHDVIRAHVSFTLSSGVEDLIFIENSTAEAGTGNQAANNMVGNSLDNMLEGLAGNDTLEGLAGSDLLIGGSGNDKLDGGSGDDALYGDEGNDIILGGGGDDLLEGGAGKDQLMGGAGNDTYVVNLTANGVLEDSMTEVYEPESYDVLQLTSVSTNTTYKEIKLAEYIEEMDASATEGSLLHLTGNNASNVIIGNDANNKITGGLGADILTGGAGDDVFVFNATDSMINFDVIDDFESGADQLLFSKSIFKNLLSASPTVNSVALTPTDFIAEMDIDVDYNAANNTSYHLLFDANSAALYYDPDGAGTMEAIQIAQVYGDLSATDIYVFL